jgi:hypothetical protein
VRHRVAATPAADHHSLFRGNIKWAERNDWIERRPHWGALNTPSGNAVFLMLCTAESGDVTRGTGFAVGDGSMVVTAAHVIRECRSCVVLRGAPDADHWASKGRVALVDEEADVGIVILEKPSPTVLRLRHRTPTAVDQLLVWDWPSWQEESLPILERGAEARALAALFTSSWTTGRGSPRFGFAARVGYGMSGGPLLDGQTGEVLGLVMGCWRVDPEEVVENWRANIGNRYDVGEKGGIDPSHLLKSIKAHLALGMGIATPADCISLVLQRV